MHISIFVDFCRVVHALFLKDNSFLGSSFHKSNKAHNHHIYLLDKTDFTQAYKKLMLKRSFCCRGLLKFLFLDRAAVDGVPKVCFGGTTNETMINPAGKEDVCVTVRGVNISVCVCM